MYKGLRGYWKRKGYTRIDGGTTDGFNRKNRVELTTTLGPTTKSRRRRFWRLKLKLKFRLKSTKKFLKRVRDAYVNLMLGFENSRAFNSGFGGVGAVNYGVGGGGVGGFGKPQLKEYDEKVLVDFYKSLMAQGTLMPRDAIKIISTDGIACRTN